MPETKRITATVDYQSADDGTELCRRIWRPETTPTALLYIAHGYAEYGGRYDRFAQELTRSGYALAIMDYRGHGQSQGERVYIDSIDRLAADLTRMRKITEAEYPDIPVFLFGFSLGSLTVIKSLLDYPEFVQGMILSGNALTADELLPTFVISLVHGLAKLTPRFRFAPAIPAEAMSTDPDVVQAYLIDPLIDRGRWRLITSSAVMKAVIECRLRLNEIRTPLLVMHGEQDKILPLSGARCAIEKAGTSDKTLNTYSNEYHDLLNSSSQHQVLNDLTSWINKHLL